MIDLSCFIALLVVFLACVRILHMNSRAEWPELFYESGYRYAISSSNDANGNREKAKGGFVSQLLKHAPIFNKP